MSVYVSIPVYEGRFDVNGTPFYFRFGCDDGNGIILEPTDFPNGHIGEDFIEKLKHAFIFYEVLRAMTTIEHLTPYDLIDADTKTVEQIIGACKSILKQNTVPFNEDKIAGAMQAAQMQLNGTLKQTIADLEKEVEETESAVTKDKSGYVYLLRGVQGAYKIGKTINPEDRIATFKLNLPFPIEYETIIYTENRHQLEKELHNRFKGRRINGEWFALDQEDVEYIMTVGIEATDV